MMLDPADPRIITLVKLLLGLAVLVAAMWSSTDRYRRPRA